ncbi:Stc1 domain-containing protein [Ilyonectria sp. MPI-CAGE-AT-0026]|nr:Stc1 domain-containing protein [Ilyonectria sp. MPI-CAGE-AT-0026]
MAPNQNKGVIRPRTSAAVPTRFRCKVGGEWKPIDAFSGNQQKLIQRSIENRRDVDAAHSGMICREHTSKSRSEIRCEVCGLIKPKDQFSKNSLKLDEYACMRCVAWTETQEPEVTPAPLETGHISVEEENVGVWQNNFESNVDFFEDDGLPKAPISDLSSLGLNDLDLFGNSDNVGSAILSHILDQRSAKERHIADTASVSGESIYTSSVSVLPPHLAGLSKASESGPKSTSGASEATRESRGSSTLPPHLRGSVPQSSSARSVSTATTVRKDKEERAQSRAIPFNAWGPTGKPYQAIKDPTISTMSSATSEKSSVKANIQDDPNIIGDWDFPPLGEPQTQSSRRWPKASESRIPQAQLKKQPILTHTKTRHIDPEIDRQRRMNYCDSDDSDY